MGRFFMLWQTLLRVGQVTLDVVRDTGVTQSVRGWAHPYIKENVGAENRDEWMLTSLRFKGNSLT